MTRLGYINRFQETILTGLDKHNFSILLSIASYLSFLAYGLGAQKNRRISFEYP